MDDRHQRDDSAAPVAGAVDRGPQSRIRVEEVAPRDFESSAAPPPGLEIADFGHAVEVRWSWFRPAAFVLVGFAALWNGVIGGVFVPGILATERWGPLEVVFALFLTPFVLVGALVALLALAMLVNRSRLTAGHGQLRVVTLPIPLFNFSIWTDEIVGFGVQRRSIAAEGRDRRAANAPSSQARLVARLASGRTRTVVQDLDEETMLWLAWRLERLLGIDGDERR